MPIDWTDIDAALKVATDAERERMKNDIRRLLAFRPIGAAAKDPESWERACAIAAREIEQ